MAKGNNQNTSNGSNLDFEAQLWAAADKMRGHMDASEYTFRNIQHPDLRADFVTANALRDSASNPAKPYAADGKRPTTTFFNN